MALKASLETLILEYPTASKDNFKGHEFAKYIKNTIPNSLKSFLALPSIYSIKASAGNGSWAKIPWISVSNTLITDTVTSGFYCIYLLRADCSGVYLSLNQGFADKRDRYGIGVSREILRKQASAYRDKLDAAQIESFSDLLDLNLNFIPKKTTARRLGLAYEAGNIISKFYPRGSIPDNELLVNDLTNLLDIYFMLFEQSSLLDTAANPIVDEEQDWFEDLSKYRIHRITERNRTLAKRVKQLQGYTCKACDFNFESWYGEIGRDYIEAHHILPISRLDKTKIHLDPIQDFTVLCSNCHRMIHRIKPTPSLEEFKKVLKTCTTNSR